MIVRGNPCGYHLRETIYDWRFENLDDIAFKIKSKALGRLYDSIYNRLWVRLREHYYVVR